MIQGLQVYIQAVNYFGKETQIASVSLIVKSSSQTCTDSDGGENYYVKGSTTGPTVEGVMGTDTDTCNQDNTFLLESWCYGKYRTKTIYQCPNGCYDGACIQLPNYTCTDSDGGKNYNVKGTTYGVLYTTASIEPYKTYSDECSSQNGQLIEYYCRSGNNSYLDIQWYTCPYGCKDGRCISPSNDCNIQQNGICPQSCSIDSDPDCCFQSGKSWINNNCISSTQVNCTDSDGGINYYVKGKTLGINGERNDYCFDSYGATYLEENYCDENGYAQPVQEAYICPNGCQDGACIQANVTQ
jgi:hypothetical protein